MAPQGSIAWSDGIEICPDVPSIDPTGKSSAGREELAPTAATDTY